MPGAKRGTREAGVPEFRAFCGVLRAVGRERRRRGVTHVVTQAPGVCAGPVCCAVAGLGFTGVMVISPARARALEGPRGRGRGPAAGPA